MAEHSLMRIADTIINITYSGQFEKDAKIWLEALMGFPPKKCEWIKENGDNK